MMATRYLVKRSCNSKVISQFGRFHSTEPEYAFEMATSSVRFGRGASKEVGQDLLTMGLTKKVCVITDKKLAKLPPVQVVLDSLTRNGIQFEVYDDTAVEPTDKSLLHAIDFCKRGQFEAFVAVGGGSSIDTGKYSLYP